VGDAARVGAEDGAPGAGSSSDGTRIALILYGTRITRILHTGCGSHGFFTRDADHTDVTSGSVLKKWLVEDRHHGHVVLRCSQRW
jgi:hypothetical protein